MSKKNRRGHNKFQFVTMDELNQMKENAKAIQESEKDVMIQTENVVVPDTKEEIEEEVKEISPIVKEEVVEEAKEEVKETPKQEENTNADLKKKSYFSFESRITTMVVITLVLFIMACVLIVHILHRNQDEVVAYQEDNEVSYQVCLLDGKCRGENLEYISADTDQFLIHFKQDVHYSQIVHYERTYYAKIMLRIFPITDTTETIYQTEDVLFQEKQSEDGDQSSLDREVMISFADYYRVIQQYKVDNEVGVNMEIVLYVNDGSDARKLSALLISYEDTYHIVKSYVPKTEGTMRITKTFWDAYTIVATILISLLLGASLYLLYKITNYITKTTSTHNEYHRKLLKILREYDRIIVIARGGYESGSVKEIHKVDSFEELLEIRKHLQKPIIYSRVNDVKSDFIVEDEDKIYKYVFKEADM